MNEQQLLINIDEIGEQIESILRQVRASSPAASPARMAIFQQMRQTATVDSHWHIAWPHWPPGISAKIAAVLQKVTRRLLQWYIDPIVEQQNRFNQTVVNALQLMADDVAALQISYQSLSDTQQSQIDQMQQQIDALSKKLQNKDG